MMRSVIKMGIIRVSGDKNRAPQCSRQLNQRIFTLLKTATQTLFLIINGVLRPVIWPMKTLCIEILPQAKMYEKQHNNINKP